MLRRLRAIEIAEGALLADLALVFQLIVVYIPLPLVGDFFRMLIFVVFAILVLRRGLYVGIMGMFISFFLIGVTLGPQYLVVTSLEAMGGIFLGFTMRHRLQHIPLLFLGITSGAFTLFCLVLLSFWVAGFHIDTIMQPFHDLYRATIPILNQIATRLGFSALWRNQLYPVVNTITNFLFAYWLLLIYLVLWILLVPFVTVIYLATNIFVRMLGYDVRPFPDGLLNRIGQETVRTFAVMSRKRERGWFLHFLLTDARHASILVKKSFWHRSRKQSYKA
jgi:hypothetical protein